MGSNPTLSASGAIFGLHRFCTRKPWPFGERVVVDARWRPTAVLDAATELVDGAFALGWVVVLALAAQYSRLCLTDQQTSTRIFARRLSWGARSFDRAIKTLTSEGAKQADFAFGRRGAHAPASEGAPMLEALRCKVKGHMFVDSRSQPGTQVCVRCRHRQPFEGLGAPIRSAPTDGGAAPPA